MESHGDKLQRLEKGMKDCQDLADSLKEERLQMLSALLVSAEEDAAKQRDCEQRLGGR